MSLLATSAAMIAYGLHAGTAAVQAQPVPAASAGRIYSFDIPAKPLPRALNDIGRVTGLSIVFTEQRAFSVAGQPVRGSMTAQQALAAALAGTGVGYRFTNPRTVTIDRPGSQTGTGAAVAGAIALDPIDVRGESAFGPENGFIAQNSVAGSKTNTPIIETPYSVSVVNRKQLDVQNPQSLQDALRYTPGVATGFFGADTRSPKVQIFLRGFGDDGVSPIYWNGLALPSDIYVNSPTLDPYNLERIEVLRGPASVLYGQASPGGIVNARSKRPTDTPIREVVLGTGSFGRTYGAFDLGGPIDPQGQWLYRLTGVAYHTGTQIDDTANERISIAPSLTWRPSSDTRVTILATHQRDPDGVGFQSLPLEGTLLPGPAGKIPRRFNFGEPGYDHLDRSSSSIGYEFEHRFNDVWTVRQNARFLHAEGTYREIQPSGWVAPGSSLMERWNWGTRGQLNAFAIDNQAEARFSTGALAHTALFGLDYKGQWSHVAHSWDRAGVLPLDMLNPIRAYPAGPAPVFANTIARLEQIGVYAQDQIALGNWRFLIGGRKDWAENASTNLRTLVNPTTTEKSDAFTWRAGAVYLFENGLAPYASYATSFQPQGGTDFSGAMFKPTTAEQYEIGVKYQPAGLRSFVQASLFDLTQQNVLSTDPLHFGFSVQTGEVRSKGVELSANLALMENFNLIASYTYTSLETTKANPDDTGFDPTGRVPWYYPKQLASLWADYTFQTGVLAGLRIGGGVRYVGSAYNGPHELHTVPDYALVDAAINYDFGVTNPSLRGLELGVNVSNLFDKEYLARCSEINCSYGIERTILANLKYKW